MITPSLLPGGTLQAEAKEGETKAEPSGLS